MSGGLPAPVRRHLERALPRAGAAPGQVRIAQAGSMWQKPGGRELRFTAEQRIAVDRVAFSWRARFPLLGPLALEVVDGYADGAGQLVVRVLGMPVQRQGGPETTSGEALRYLAELPWAPHALAANGELEWRELDDRRAEVAATVAGERLAVDLELDAAGHVVRASSRQRLFQVGAGWEPTPWAGEFSAYERLGGVRIPTRAQVSWELESGPFVYWRGAVTGLELLEEPFAA